MEKMEEFKHLMDGKEQVSCQVLIDREMSKYKQRLLTVAKRMQEEYERLYTEEDTIVGIDEFLEEMGLIE